jgi:hypothetical protein
VARKDIVVGNDTTRTIKQSTVMYAAAAITIIVAVSLGAGVMFLRTAQEQLLEASRRQVEFRQLGIDLAAASDLLTNEVRAYAVREPALSAAAPG